MYPPEVARSIRRPRPILMKLSGFVELWMLMILATKKLRVKKWNIYPRGLRMIAIEPQAVLKLCNQIRKTMAIKISREKLAYHAGKIRPVLCSSRGENKLVHVVEYHQVYTTIYSKFSVHPPFSKKCGIKSQYMKISWKPLGNLWRPNGFSNSNIAWCSFSRGIRISPWFWNLNKLS